MIIVKITDGTRKKKIFWILHRTIKYMHLKPNL